jgi:hypothetical protein
MATSVNNTNTSGISEGDSSGANNATDTGMASLSQEISDFANLTTVVRNVFDKEITSVLKRGVIWVILFLFCVGFLICYYMHNMDWTEKTLPFFLKPANLTLASGYEIGIRITLVSLIISFLIFCLKMIRNYLALYEQLRHKLIIIDSMPTLILASDEDDVYKSSYNKIVDMLVSIDNINTINNEEIKVNSIIDFLKEVSKKD